MEILDLKKQIRNNQVKADHKIPDQKREAEITGKKCYIKEGIDQLISRKEITEKIGINGRIQTYIII